MLFSPLKRYKLSIHRTSIYGKILNFRYICHRHRNQVKEKMERFRCSYINGVPAGMLADAQMNGGISNAHAQWFSHWKIRADDCDVMK